MSFALRCRLLVVVAVAGAAFGCGRTPGTEAPEYKTGVATAGGGLVGPLKDDSSEQIVSWVEVSRCPTGRRRSPSARRRSTAT